MNRIGDDELLELAARARDNTRSVFGEITQRCVPTAAALLHQLRQRGAGGRLACGYYLDGEGFPNVHTWIVLDDGRIVDPTREQFEPGALVTVIEDEQYQLHGFSANEDMRWLLRFWGWKEQLREEVRALGALFEIEVRYPDEVAVAA